MKNTIETTKDPKHFRNKWILGYLFKKNILNDVVT